MNNSIFSGIFETESGSSIQISDFLLCLFVSIIIGLFLATIYTYKNTYTQSFVMTLALIPPAVCMIILLVNGNIGAGVAVTGAFSLVRFRSAPGNGKEISAIFLAMAAGLATGMGYLAYALLFSFILGGICILFTLLNFGAARKSLQKTLLITIPEDLNYTDVFNDILDNYTTSHRLLHVKTTNMGSMFRLTYDIQLKSFDIEKEFIDELRCRNGNLEISIMQSSSNSMEL